MITDNNFILPWTKSSFCDSGGCVEVSFEGQVVRVRNSRTHHTATFTLKEWKAFVAGVRNGELSGPE